MRRIPHTCAVKTGRRTGDGGGSSPTVVDTLDFRSTKSVRSWKVERDRDLRKGLSVCRRCEGLGETVSWVTQRSRDDYIDDAALSAVEGETPGRRPESCTSLYPLPPTTSYYLPPLFPTLSL